LGNAHRTIHAARPSFVDNRNGRKIIPTTPKTLGDRIFLSRYERRLKQSEVAAKLGISWRTIHAWERDQQVPNTDQWKALAGLLGLPNEVMEQGNPTPE